MNKLQVVDVVPRPMLIELNLHGTEKQESPPEKHPQTPF